MQMAVVGDRLSPLLDGGPLPIEARFSLPFAGGGFSTCFQDSFR